MVRRLARGKRVAGIESGVVALHHPGAMEFVRSGFREDFDARVSKLVVFRRKRIGVDANLADCRFGRQLSGGETVNVHLSAVWPSGRPRKSLQVLRELVGIIRERVE